MSVLMQYGVISRGGLIRGAWSYTRYAPLCSILHNFKRGGLIHGVVLFPSLYGTLGLLRLCSSSYYYSKPPSVLPLSSWPRHKHRSSSDQSYYIEQDVLSHLIALLLTRQCSQAENPRGVAVTNAPRPPSPWNTTSAVLWPAAPSRRRCAAPF